MTIEPLTAMVQSIAAGPALLISIPFALWAGVICWHDTIAPKLIRRRHERREAGRLT